MADDDSYVSYLEGCTAPMRDENQLHAAIVEIVVENRAEVKYSTVQNWYAAATATDAAAYTTSSPSEDSAADATQSCRGLRSRPDRQSHGSTPHACLRAKAPPYEFYSVAVTNNRQQADTGTKMIHLAPNTRSTIVSKGISAGRSQNSYRGQVKVVASAHGCRNYTQCDSLLLGLPTAEHTHSPISMS